MTPHVSGSRRKGMFLIRISCALQVSHTAVLYCLVSLTRIVVEAPNWDPVVSQKMERRVWQNHEMPLKASV